jgi:hypothetical protein
LTLKCADLAPQRIGRWGRFIGAMPQDVSPSDLAASVRDQYRDVHGTTTLIQRSAAWDAGFVELALQQVKVARAAIEDLVRAGDVPITRSLGEESEALQGMTMAEQGLRCVLAALRQV